MAIDFSLEDQPYNAPDLNTVDDNDEDQPIAILASRPVLAFGGAALSTVYNTQAHLDSSTPLRTVRLALRSGISMFDTSPYYGNSEIVLGSLLRQLAAEHPRSSYQLVRADRASSKCGRYGLPKTDFDYSPAAIRNSLKRTLRRLGTDYLDVFYLHDVEFVATRLPGELSSNSAAALADENARKGWGISEGEEANVLGDGDQVVLTAYGELRKLKSEGLVRSIGITGYPLPVLLRLALLIKAHFGEPVESIMTYSHYNLQNISLTQFIGEFAQRAGVTTIYSASPLNMGLLGPNPPPWHFAPPGMFAARDKAVDVIESAKWPGGFANLATGFAFTTSNAVDGRLPSDITTVVGLSSMEEVRKAVEVWKEVNAEGGDNVSRIALEAQVRDCFVSAGWADWSWESGRD
ncbi:Aldo/keto reductase [Clavulina sp. PMI_390]|nr:Aldo/keto reductase [Clavulina sp. PMI_390]